MDLGRLLGPAPRGWGSARRSSAPPPPGSGGSSSAGPFPGRRATLVAAGLEGRVEIARDRWGMPTVRARTAADLWFGQGFCHGQDRLWQCDLHRRVSSGRVSEIAGHAGPPGRPADADPGAAPSGPARGGRARPGAARAARRLLRRAQPGRARRLAPCRPSSSCCGCEFEPWRPADMLAGGKLLSFGLSTNWERELLRADLVRELGEERAARLDPTYPKGNPVALRPGEGFDGERARASPSRSAGSASRSGSRRPPAARTTGPSAPSRSATGGALLAGDPHLPSGMPGVWYEVGAGARRAHLPRRLDPGPARDLAGPERRRRLRLHQRDGRRRGPVRRADRGRELRVHGGAAPAGDRRGADHGPGPGAAGAPRGAAHPPRPDRERARSGADDEQPLALRWAALDQPSISHAHVGVLEPTSGPELVELLRTVTMPVSNLVWADRHGSIGYKMMGRIPMRKGDCPDLPKPGWTGEFEWEGWIPYEEMPELVDPERGLHRHRQQPGGRRLLSPPHHQRLARRLPRRADRAADRGDRRARSRRASAGCRPTSTRSPATRSSTGSPASSRPASARSGRSSG